MSNVDHIEGAEALICGRRWFGGPRGVWRHCAAPVVAVRDGQPWCQRHDPVAKAERFAAMVASAQPAQAVKGGA